MENVKPVEIGRLVASDRRGDRNTKLMIVVDDRSGIVQEADKAAGFQLAETRGTFPTLVFFQVPEADLFTVRNWGGTVARTVKFWEVDTVVVDGVIMAGVGAPLPDGMVRA